MVISSEKLYFERKLIKNLGLLFFRVSINPALRDLKTDKIIQEKMIFLKRNNTRYFEDVLLPGMWFFRL